MNKATTCHYLYHRTHHSDKFDSDGDSTASYPGRLWHCLVSIRIIVRSLSASTGTAFTTRYIVQTSCGPAPGDQSLPYSEN